MKTSTFYPLFIYSCISLWIYSNFPAKTPAQIGGLFAWPDVSPGFIITGLQLCEVYTIHHILLQVYEVCTKYTKYMIYILPVQIHIYNQVFGACQKFKRVVCLDPYLKELVISMTFLHKILQAYTAYMLHLMQRRTFLAF